MKREQRHEPVWERFAEPPSLADNADAVAAMAHRLKTQNGNAHQPDGFVARYTQQIDGQPSL